MDIESFKRWHWLMVGGIFGLLIGLAWHFVPPGRDPVMRLPMTVSQLVQQVKTSNVTHEATLRDLDVYPPSGDRQMIIGSVSAGNGWLPFSAYVTLPFKPTPDSPAVDVREFLGLSSGGQINVRYLWWKASWFGPALGIMIGLAVVGGLWPAVVGSMVKAGMGRDKPVEEVKPAPPPPVVEVVPPPAPILVNHAQELDEEVEQAMRGGASAGTGTHQTKAEPAIKPLDQEALKEIAPTEREKKDYGGEFYPVARPKHQKDGFTLIELLVVIGIIAVLMSIILPSLHVVQARASALQCASNIRELGKAMQMYANDNEGVYFWRGADIDTDGMDWYAYGGKETGNLDLDQSGLFNRIIPRPLNQYVSNALRVFRCPMDTEAPWTNDTSYTKYPAPSQFEWVGNSYNFNANGYPLRDLPRNEGGLDGVKIGGLSSSSITIVFYEAALYYGFDWHYAHEGNVGFADGHVEFLPMPDQVGQYNWNP